MLFSSPVVWSLAEELLLRSVFPKNVNILPECVVCEFGFCGGVRVGGYFSSFGLRNNNEAVRERKKKERKNKRRKLQKAKSLQKKKEKKEKETKTKKNTPNKRV